MQPSPKSKKPLHSRRAFFPSLAISLVIAAVGIILLQTSLAATVVVYAEAEDALQEGASTNASVVADNQASNSKALQFGVAAVPPSAACAATSGQTLQDQNPGDNTAPPWQKTTDKLPIYFVTGSLPAEYAGYVGEGVTAWSQSPCIDAQAVAACPAAATTCVPMSTEPGDGSNLTGTTSYSYSGSYRSKADIVLYTTSLGRTDARTKRITTLHEMGHAIGLAHRETAEKLMAPVSDDKSESDPDAIDFANIMTTYGQN